MSTKFMYLFFLLLLNGKMYSNITPVKAVEARFVVENYMETLSAYCQKYEAGHRFHIEEYLLMSPNIKIGNDIAGLENKDNQANWYFIDLKRQGVVVQYDSDFKITSCQVHGQPFTGCVLNKKLYYPNGQVANYQELIELLEVSSQGYRIKSIASDLFYDLTNYNCMSSVKKPSTSTLPSTADGSNQQQNITALLKQADSAFQQGAYEKALNQYQAILEKDKGTLAPKITEAIQEKMVRCQLELEYYRLVEEASYQFARYAYQEALPLYERALTIRPDDQSLVNRYQECKALIKEAIAKKILAELQIATSQVENGHTDTGFRTLLKYRDTGLLDSTQFFYLALIMDTRPKFLKKEFYMSNWDCCVLTRQFAIAAKNKGANSEDFEFFWKAHFNKKSRTCKD